MSTTRRTAEIAKVMSKHGLDWLAQSHSPWRFLTLPRQWFVEKPQTSKPENLRLALEELGTTYIKLGQAVSTRTDLVPPEYAEELARLQDDAPPIPFEEVANVVREELGASPDMVFSWFDHEPLAAASIGQVHRATLPDGKRVVVKVQRPLAEKQVEEDLLVLKEVVKLLSATSKWSSYDFEGLLTEFAFKIRNELDYRREGRNADRFRLNFASDPMLKVPLIYWDLTTKRVLTMEEIGGIKVTETALLDEAGHDRTRLADEAARLVLNEIFHFGLFHADPHAGNFFVQDDGSLALIDFGMVGKLDRMQRESLMRMSLAMAYQDADTLVDELLTIGLARKPVNQQELKIEISRLMEDHMDAPPEEFSMAAMFQDTLAMAARHEIRIPSDLLFLARTLAMCEGLVAVLDPDYQMLGATRTHLTNIYREQYSPERLMDRTKENYLEFGQFALEAPRRLRRLFGQLERGEIMFTARLGDSSELLENFHRAVNRLSISVLVAGVIAGLSVLTLKLGRNQEVWSTWVNFLLFGVIAVGLFLLVSIWKSRKA
jgi:ubiquinone biosynthesis protein